MSAPMHNLNARKWTAEIVLSALYEIEKDTEALYLGTALYRLRVTPKAWSYWKKIFHDHEDISTMMELLELKYETKLVEGSLRGEIRGANANFVLKYRHGWGNETPQTGLPAPAASDREPAIIKLSGGRVISLP